MAPSEHAPQIVDVADAVAYRISPEDSVMLAPLRGPDEVYDASVFFEIWEPGGSQPVNSHPGSTETFLILQGEAVAYCDDHVSPLRAGQFLVLPPKSDHRIENVGTERLYAITTMTPDAGFTALVTGGERTTLDAADLAVLHASRP